MPTCVRCRAWSAPSLQLGECPRCSGELRSDGRWQEPEGTNSVADAIDTVAKRGGSVSIGRSVEIEYGWKAGGSLHLTGEVTAFVDRHGARLAELGWTSPRPDDLQAADQANVEAVERHRLGDGQDYRLTYRREWSLPPSSAVTIATEVKTVLQVVGDDGASGAPSVRVAGLLDNEAAGLYGCFIGPISVVVGGLVASALMFVGPQVAAVPVFHAWIAGAVTWLAWWRLAGSVLPRMPGARDWADIAFALGMVVLPALAVVGWALFGP
jgi:hypothetical protein